MVLELEGIVVIARDEWRGSNDVALSIGDGQDVGGLGPFASLIGHRFATFLGNGVTAIEIELRQIQVVLDRHNTRFPRPFQAAISAPLAKMVVHSTQSPVSPCSGRVEYVH